MSTAGAAPRDGDGVRDEADGERVAVVADDLTGAADTAVQFATAGWPTRLALHLDDLADVRGAVAVSTDARAMGEGARSATAGAVRALRDRGAGRLYLKIDSTLRGAVADEIAGALDAWGDGSLALVCPAYPAMGRIVRGGVASVDGRALEDGPAGRDPVTPVTTSVLTELLPGAVRLPADRCASAVGLLDAARATSAAVVCLDAVDDGDLDVIADAVVLGERVVAVGSAGLARALAARWRSCDPGGAVVPDTPHGDGPVVVMVTSLHDVAAEQVRHLIGEIAVGVVHLEPTTTDLADPPAVGWLQRLDAALREDAAPVVVVSAPSQRTAGADAARVATAMADAVARLHRVAPLRGVVAVGGDGASALARRWSATAITVHGSVAEGVPHGVLDGGQAGALRVVTKAGGFGAPNALAAAVTHLLAPTAPREDRP